MVHLIRRYFLGRSLLLVKENGAYHLKASLGSLLHIVYGFMGCMAQSRGGELLGRGADLVIGTQKYHRVAEYVEEIFSARTEARMDDLRTSIVDTDEEENSQNTIRDGAADEGAVTAFVS